MTRLKVAAALTSLLLIAPPGPSAGTAQPHRVSQLAFIAGDWYGPLFGGQADESWMAPRDGAMLGSFRLTWPDSGKRLYELLIIEETQPGEVILSFRHFGPGMELWEEEIEAPLRFALVDVGERRAVFESPVPTQKPARFIFELNQPGTELAVTVQSLSADGDVAEEFVASYTRRNIR